MTDARGWGGHMIEAGRGSPCKPRKRRPSRHSPPCFQKAGEGRVEGAEWEKLAAKGKPGVGGACTRRKVQAEQEDGT